MKAIIRTLIAATAIITIAPAAYVWSEKPLKTKAKTEALTRAAQVKSSEAKVTGAQAVKTQAVKAQTAETAVAVAGDQTLDAGDLEQRRQLSQAAATVIASSVNRALNQLGLMGVPLDRKLVGEVIAAALNGAGTPMEMEEANALIDDYLKNLRRASADTLSRASQREFLDNEAGKPGSIVLPSGVIVQIVTEGEGEHPTEADSVVVRYSGKLYDGRVFDATQGDEEVTFPVSGLVDGFTEGLLQTKPGGTYRIIIPADKGYGPDGIPGAIPGNAALDFTVEILRVVRAGALKQPHRP